jgi:hypothetical protein
MLGQSGDVVACLPESAARRASEPSTGRVHRRACIGEPSREGIMTIIAALLTSPLVA